MTTHKFEFVESLGIGVKKDREVITARYRCKICGTEIIGQFHTSQEPASLGPYDRHLYYTDCDLMIVKQVLNS